MEVPWRIVFFLSLVPLCTKQILWAEGTYSSEIAFFGYLTFFYNFNYSTDTNLRMLRFLATLFEKIRNIIKKKRNIIRFV